MYIAINMAAYISIVRAGVCVCVCVWVCVCVYAQDGLAHYPHPFYFLNNSGLQEKPRDCWSK